MTDLVRYNSSQKMNSWMKKKEPKARAFRTEKETMKMRSTRKIKTIISTRSIAAFIMPILFLPTGFSNY
jgi:hypothetical protein